MAGWISLHRKLMDNPIYSNANMLKLWIHCLMKASHSGHEQLVGNQMVKLEVGQFVTGRNALEDEFNKGAKKDEVVSGRTLWRWIKNFEEWQMLSIKSTTKYSVVTVINWSEHQQHDQQVSNSRPTDVQQLSTNNNVNNANNDNKDNKKELSRKQVYDEDSPPFILADFFYKEILKNNPNYKVPNLQKWSDDIRKLIELDKRDKKEISMLMRWVQQDDFEMSNVLSPAKLRSRYDALVMKMNKPNLPSNVHRFEPSKKVENEHKYDYGF